MSCPSLFLTIRTLIIHLRSLRTKESHRHRPRLKELYRCSMEPETPWPRCRPHGHRVTTGSPLSDFSLRSRRITAKSESGAHSLSKNRPSFIFFSYSWEVALVMFTLSCRAYVSRDRLLGEKFPFFPSSHCIAAKPNPTIALSTISTTGPRYQQTNTFPSCLHIYFFLSIISFPRLFRLSNDDDEAQPQWRPPQGPQLTAVRSH